MDEHDEAYLVECECGEYGHMLVIKHYPPGTWADDVPFFDVVVQVPRPGILRRMWWALRYVFTRDGLLWGDWQSTMLTRDKAIGLAVWMYRMATLSDRGEGVTTTAQSYE